MGIKRIVHEYCQDCGELAVRVEGDYIWWGGHTCSTNQPPHLEGRPQSVPRRTHKNDIRFISGVNQHATENGS